MNASQEQRTTDRSLAAVTARRGAAFTLIELLVVIAIIAILAAILFPVFLAAKERGRAAQCLAHVRQIGIAVQNYIADWNDSYPLNRFLNEGVIPDPLPHYRTWKQAIRPMVKNGAVYLCPSNEGYITKWGPNKGRDESGEFPISYAYNGAAFGWEDMRPLKMSELYLPSRIIFILESRLYFPDIGPWCLDYVGLPSGQFGNKKGAFQVHTGKRANWLFADLHVQSLTIQQTCVPANMWGGRIRRGDRKYHPWQDQPWFDDLIAQGHLAPDYQ